MVAENEIIGMSYKFSNVLEIKYVKNGFLGQLGEGME